MNPVNYCIKEAEIIFMYECRFLDGVKSAISSLQALFINLLFGDNFH